MSLNTVHNQLRRLATTAMSEDVAGLLHAAEPDLSLVSGVPTAAPLAAAASAFVAAARAHIDAVGRA